MSKNTHARGPIFSFPCPNFPSFHERKRRLLMKSESSRLSFNRQGRNCLDKRVAFIVANEVVSSCRWLETKDSTGRVAKFAVRFSANVCFDNSRPSDVANEGGRGGVSIPINYITSRVTVWPSSALINHLLFIDVHY